MRVTLGVLVLGCALFAHGCAGKNASTDNANAGSAGVGGGSPDPVCQDVQYACTTTCAIAGDPCALDCDTSCGYDATGVQHCTCAAGVFTACTCSPPSSCSVMDAGVASVAPWWQCWTGAPTAPSCAAFGAPSGRTSELVGRSCSEAVWTACVGTDVGTSPRGCVCIPPGQYYGASAWVCGNTNGWFTLQ